MRSTSTGAGNVTVHVALPAGCQVVASSLSKASVPSPAVAMISGGRRLRHRPRQTLAVPADEVAEEIAVGHRIPAELDIEAGPVRREAGDGSGWGRSTSA